MSKAVKAMIAGELRERLGEFDGACVVGLSGMKVDEQQRLRRGWFATASESEEHALFHTDMIRYPRVVDLNLADLNLAVNALFYGLGRVFGPALAYNAALLLAFLLSGLLMQRLGRRLGATGAAAWLAGLLFAASP